MNAGHCTREQLQGWICNRFYYQLSIPLKDAAILSNCPDREVRREWIKRIVDHDGTQGSEGGIEAWIRLGVAAGVPREELTSLQHVLPGVRFAVDAYVNFARTRPWQEAVCSSLTELFAPRFTSIALPAGRSITRGSIRQGLRTSASGWRWRDATWRTAWSSH